MENTSLSTYKINSTNLTQQNTLTQVETCDDEEKTIVLERYYIDENSLKQGLFERFYENGQHQIKCIYKDDKQDGLFEWFHENK